MRPMRRPVRTLVIALPLAWATGVLVYRATLAPAALAVFQRPFPPLTRQLHDDPILGRFHRFLDAVRPALPRRARVVLIGPGTRAWPGDREEHYKQFLFRMLPRRVQAPRRPRDLPRLLAWADHVVVYRTPLPASEIPGFARVLDLGEEGAVFRRREARP